MHLPELFSLNRTNTFPAEDKLSSYPSVLPGRAFLITYWVAVTTGLIHAAIVI